ncbi:MAG: DNA alkylation repair protein [Candidatus Thiodiazotropha sp. (ex Epidulcina cf. delphinae)]|nr:DNA alkylation repair protein [Candidatus Thiodiazotropha sp. (ex Epidulcina cf. delphinae)]
MKAVQLSKILHGLADPSIASHSQRFFKTGKGEYGEGDRFLGIRVPILRQQAKRHQEMPLAEIRRLLKSRFHEERLCALLLLVRKFARGDEKERRAIYQLYMDSTRYINNWDLVDSSAYHIVGVYLADKERHPLYELAVASNLWERRIAIMSTLHFIKNHQFGDTLKLSRQLLDDNQDLIHKSVGWMLREIGNRDRSVTQDFLNKHYKRMPRTMLRYAIEKFPETLRKEYLAGRI